MKWKETKQKYYYEPGDGTLLRLQKNGNYKKDEYDFIFVFTYWDKIKTFDMIGRSGNFIFQLDDFQMPYEEIIAICEHNRQQIRGIMLLVERFPHDYTLRHPLVTRIPGVNFSFPLFYS